MSAPITPAAPSFADQVRLVAGREIKAKVGSRPFWIGGAIMVTVVIVLIALNAFLSDHKTTYKIGTTTPEASSVASGAGVVMRGIDDNSRVKKVSYSSTAALRTAVRDGKVDAGLVRSSAGWTVVAKGSTDSKLMQAIAVAVNPPATATPITPQVLDPVPDNDAARQVLAFALAFVFFLTAMMFGVGIAQSVVEEKESRVVEILAAACPTRRLLWGKVLGNSAIAFGEVATLVLIAAVGLLVTGYSDLLSGIGGVLIWFLLFFVLGFIALSAMWSAAGALANRVADMQTTTMPLQFLLTAGYVLGFAFGGQPRAIGSFIPVISAIVMPSRMAAEVVPLWQVLVSLGLNVVAAVLLVRLGAAIYDRNLLQTKGNRNLFNALRHTS